MWFCCYQFNLSPLEAVRFNILPCNDFSSSGMSLRDVRGHIVFKPRRTQVNCRAWHIIDMQQPHAVSLEYHGVRDNPRTQCSFVETFHGLYVNYNHVIQRKFIPGNMTYKRYMGRNISDIAYLSKQPISP